MIPPKLPEQWIVFILRASRLIVVWVVPTKHVQVCVVSDTAMPAAGRGCAMSWKGGKQGLKMWMNILTQSGQSG